MTRILRVSALLSLMILSCTLYRARIPGTFSDGNRYVNNTVGFRMELPPDWHIGTTPNAVAPSLRSYFRSMQTKSSELLFIGMNGNQRCGVRCVVEASDLSLEEYFKELYYANEHNFHPVRCDYYSDDDREAIDFLYHAETGNMKFRYREFYFPSGTNKIRLTFWTLTGLYDDYQPAMEEMVHTVRTALPSSEGADKWRDTPLFAVAEHPVKPARIGYASNQKEIDALADGSDTVCNGHDRSFLWKVTGGSVDCWLFGSIHVLKPEMYPLKPVVEEAFDSSTTLVLELDNDKPENTKKLGEFVSKGIFSGDSTIRQVLSAQLYDSMLLYLEKKGIPPSGFKKLRPWMAALMLQQLQIQSLGFSAEFGVEQYFLKKLGRRGIEELESVEEQITLLSELGGPEFLGYTLRDIESTERYLRPLIAAWSCGNVGAMKHYLFEGTQDAPEEMIEKLLYRRNKRMAERIKGMIGEGKKCFVVVGAAHLVGERSVVEYLQQAGYTVEQF